MLPVSFAHWTTIAIWRSCWQGISHLWWRSGGRWERSLMPLFSFQIMGLFSFYARGGIHDAFQWQSQRYATSAMLQGGVTGWWFRNCNPFSVFNNAQRACTVIFFLFSFPPGPLFSSRACFCMHAVIPKLSQSDTNPKLPRKDGGNTILSWLLSVATYQGEP